MLGKGYRWCLNNCGKNVVSTMAEYGNTQKRLYRCNVCDEKYILEKRNTLKVVHVKIHNGKS